MPTKIDYLKELDVFQEFSDSEIASLASLAHLKGFRSEDLIFDADRLSGKVYLLKKGEVRIYALDEEGRRVVLDILGPGSVFGDFSGDEAPSFDEEIYAEASSDGYLCVVSRDDFYQLLKDRPDVLIKVMSQLSRKLRSAEAKIKDLALKDAKTQIVNTLLRLGQEHGSEDEEGIHLSQRLTHEQIAEMCGLTRETVTKCLNLLKKEGAIKQDSEKKYVVIK